MGLILLDGMRDLFSEVLMLFFQLCNDLVSRFQYNSFKGNLEFGVKAVKNGFSNLTKEQIG